MNKIRRQICSCICLIALICGGQLSVCACDIAPKSSCDAHNGSDKDSHTDQNAPGSDADCPCAMCHSCQHAPLVLTGLTVTVHCPVASESPSDGVMVIADQMAEIFIPPKLS